MGLRFGTDGVRGVANTELTPELALALGRAAARVLAPRRVVVGRDTRRSGPLLEAALAAGLAGEGVDVELLGVVPTPAVALAAGADGVAGAMVSASHNPFADNGIKLFAPGGRKLPDAVEAQIEAALADLGATTGPAGAAVGRVTSAAGGVAGYEERLLATLEGRRLDGLHVVLDCAHGSASTIAPEVFRAAGARVDVIGAEPDGCNINDRCGAAHPEAVAAAVVRRGAHCGLAFDGDADRCIAADHLGQVVDGDQILAILAPDLRARGALRGHTVVVTVMTNLGFRQAMQAQGIAVVDTAVGDRYVLEALDDGGWSLGGEQSGHVIFHDHWPTGDGVLTGLAVADVVVRSGRVLADLAAAAMTRLPQVLVNVRVGTRVDDVGARLAGAIAAAEAELGRSGRVLVRGSGTEPLVRVMVEAPTHEQASAVADRLAAAARTAWSAG